MSKTHKAYIEELRHTVTVAGLNHEIWWTYKSKDTRPQFLDVMNEYSIFFQTSIHAHFVALLVSLYRLYETRKDTYNIPTFLELLEKDAVLPSGTMQSLRSKYAQAKPLWIKVNILRNKVFGHRSVAHTSEEAFAEAAVTPDQLRELMELTKSLLNELTHKLEKSTHAFNFGAGSDIVRLLTALRREPKAL